MISNNLISKLNKAKNLMMFKGAFRNSVRIIRNINTEIMIKVKLDILIN